MKTKITNAPDAPLADGFAPVASNQLREQPEPKPPKQSKKEIAEFNAARIHVAQALAELPELKPQDATLVEAYLETNNKIDAYAIAFPERMNNSRSKQAIRQAAYNAFARQDIQKAVHALTLAGMFGKPSTLHDHVGAMRSIKQRAIDHGELAVAQRAERSIGEVSRLYIKDVVIQRTRPRTPDELVKDLAPGNAQGQAGILDAIRAARAKPVVLDVVELTGGNEPEPVSD